MTARLSFGAALLALPLALGAACAQDPDPTPRVVERPHCAPTATGEELASRVSPYDSVALDLSGPGLVCYSRPSARGRTMIGGEHVPYGQIWRTGANEPTILHLTYPAEIAGIRVEPGSYSLYTIPGEEEWTVIVNASTSQWGHESRYPAVQDQDVGRATVPAERLDEHVETFTMHTEPRAGDAADLVLEWEHTRVRVPVRAQPR